MTRLLVFGWYFMLLHFCPSLMASKYGFLDTFSVQIHGKHPLGGAPKFNIQKNHFRPKLGLDSIATPCN